MAKEGRLSGTELIKMDVRRLKTHKDLLSDWMYVEMEEHSKKLEVFADLFEKCQNGVDVDEEFLEAIIEIDKFGKDARSESQKYVNNRQRDKGINVRASSNGPPASAQESKITTGASAARSASGAGRR